MGLPLAIMGIAGAGMQAVGAVESGDAAKASSDYQAQVARNNALIATQNETWEAQSGAAKETAEGMKTADAVGKTKAAQGASNIDVNTGSAADVRTAESKLGALDALTIRSNTSRKAYGYAVQSESDTAEAGLLQQQGSQQQTAGDISGVADFLSGASSVGGKYANLQLGNTGTSGA